jgi:preprotein translocase subunit SecA
MSLIKQLFDPNERELARLRGIVARVNDLEPETKALSDAQMAERIAAIRREIQEIDDREKEKAELNRVLPEVFALTREAAIRTIGQRHFDVQLMAGVVLHEGRIAEMKTGEGKTLAATLAMSLNAITQRGAHLVTVNDYLARRDADWMGGIYHLLGFSVGCLQHSTPTSERKGIYRLDIVYGTNNEFGFDYLRDNMVIDPDEIVQRELVYAIVDEVDSILIDEARTPLIISGSSNEDTSMYTKVDAIIRRLQSKIVTGEDKAKDIFEQFEERKRKKKEEEEKTWDYEIDEKGHTATLTDRGVAKVEQALGITNLFDFENVEIAHFVNQALKAHGLFKRDRDYIVKDSEVIIVDEFTGRLMFGRRYSEGLHQAIEAKEGVAVASESQTLATITLQNYFRLYEKLAGMTGTAKTEEEEFRKIYGFDVVVIPTNLPMIRKDNPDQIYKTEKAKYHAVVNEIIDCHKRGQPTLVGTASIEKNEVLHRMLVAKGVPHNVLNAKHHEKEALIVAQAGRVGNVTIATNMAGRGTDIVLGGNPEYLAREAVDSLEIDRTTKEGEDRYHAEYRRLVQEFKAECADGHEKVLAAGGLHIVGTERHESRRIDNQLRGRGGRQGDPGSSRFFVSLEDDLMRLYGMDRVKWLMDRLKIEDEIPLEHPWLSKAIENAQKKVEGRNFDIRKNVLQYDDVMNKQREVIYADRRNILAGTNLKEEILSFLDTAVRKLVQACVTQISSRHIEIDYEGLLEAAQSSFPLRDLTLESIEGKKEKELTDFLTERVHQEYEALEQRFGSEIMREVERVITLRVIDENWIDHLNVMDHLREGIGLRGYGQVDPLVVYAKEAFDLFTELQERIQSDVVRRLFLVQIAQPEQRRSAYNIRGTSGGDGGEPRAPIKRATAKVGRNDPCPCGSGLKYKKCHGRVAAS